MSCKALHTPFFFVHNGMLGKCRRQQMCKYGTARNEDPNLAFSERQIFHSLSRMPFVDSAELALILGEPHATIHRALTVNRVTSRQVV